MCVSGFLKECDIGASILDGFYKYYKNYVTVLNTLQLSCYYSYYYKTLELICLYVRMGDKGKTNDEKIIYNLISNSPLIILSLITLN